MSVARLEVGEILSSETPQQTAPATYRVGTLVYTRRALVVLFFWMLFGDFCFTMMEAVVPTIVPLMLKDISVSNSTIGLIVGTIPSLISMIFAPIVSYRSDRHRGPWGRRIPYLVWFSPVVTVCVILTSCSPEIGSWLHSVLTPMGVSVSRPMMILFVVGGCSVLFQFFNLFVYYIYYYLFNDVIPEQFMGRFYALFRVVGAAAGFFFSRYILGMAESHRREIFITIAIIYLVAFMLMCRNVKEGEYPPPPPDSKRAGSRLAGVRTFIRECFSLPYYWLLYLAYGVTAAGSSGIVLFRIFFAKDLGMTLDDYGKILGWGSVLLVALFYPFGWLADRIHPMRLAILAAVISLGVALGSAAFIQWKTSFFLWTMLGSVAGAIAISASGPLLPLILPKAQFGQFTSAVSLVQSAMVMVANYVVGLLVDMAGSYRLIYWWSALFGALSLVLWLFLYGAWKRRGGQHHYVAPVAPAASRQVEQ
jgi:MFS family permease